MTGQVYFIESAGRIKIGYSTNVAKRMRALNTASPASLTLLGSIPGSKKFEASIHRSLHEHRANGEWFSDCPSVRHLISSLIRRGQAAIYQPPKEAPAKKTRKPRGVYEFVDTQAPWKAIARKLDELLMRHELLIEQMPTPQARTICQMFHRAHDEFEETWMSAIDNNTLDSPAALAGVQFWFDEFVIALGAQVRGLG